MSDSTELNYASFQNAIYPYCSDLSGIREYARKKVGLLDEMTKDFFDKYILLAAGLDETDVGIHLEGNVRKSGGVSESMLSRYRNGKKMKPGIVKAYLKKGTEERTKAHFEKYLLPTIGLNGEIGILYFLGQIIKKDDSIPQVYKDDFGSLNAVETLAAFLARVFVFALTRDKDPKVAFAAENDKENKLHPMVEQVIRDITIRGESDMFLPVLDLLHLCLSDDTEEYEQIGMREHDRIAFLDKTKNLIDTLDEDHREKYHHLMMKQFTLELGRYYTIRDRGYDELLKKYEIRKDQVASVSVGENPGLTLFEIPYGAHLKIDNGTGETIAGGFVSYKPVEGDDG